LWKSIFLSANEAIFFYPLPTYLLPQYPGVILVEVDGRQVTFWEALLSIIGENRFISSANEAIFFSLLPPYK
jgi:hypothetical protein